MLALELLSVSKRFGARRALTDVNLELPEGASLGLLGPNGAGKTTTLRILYTLLRPDRGRALVDGFDSVTSPREVQTRIGVLPDVRGLYPRLTGREHIRYFGRLHGINGSELNQRIDGLVSTLGMEAFADRRAKGFSKGQTLKVALARALVHEPHNVLLDEPTNGLDVASSRAVRALIEGFRDSGRCVLFSSHIMQEVAALCDKVVVMSQGRIIHNGTLDELREATGMHDLEEAYLVAVGER